MTAVRPHDIHWLSPAAADDGAVVSAVTDLVNAVYREAEKGLWAGDAPRTTPEEVAGLTRAGEIAVARLDERIIGCVRVRRVDDTMSEFGMLAADPAHRGVGLGRDLVRFAEQAAQVAGHDDMQLELLAPRGWTHPSKAFLAGWYGRLGYRMVRTGTVEDHHPRLASQLATPCHILVYRKILRA